MVIGISNRVFASGGRATSISAGLETKNRKPMRPNPVAPWELRIGILRVYYEIEAAEPVVRILAVGVKERDVVRIGGEVIKL